MEECKLQFNISGEWITGLVREWFYLEGKGYDKCIEILNDCMSGTDETKEQIRRHAEDVLLGRAATNENNRTKNRNARRRKGARRGWNNS